MDYIETPLKSYAKKPVTGIAKTRKSTPKKAKVSNMDKNQYKKAKQAHKAAVVKLKQDIKKHKLLMKQAKLVYKISKMKEAK